MSKPHKWDPVCPRPNRLALPVPLDPAGIGGPTRAQARGNKWRSTSRGLYLPCSVLDELPEQRILEQSMRLPADGAVTGWAACRLWGANFFDGLLPDGVTRMTVPLAIGQRARLRGDPKVSLHRDRLDQEEIAIICGIPCTRPLRALFDAMRTARSVREAVVAMDMMTAAKLVSIKRMRRYLSKHRTWNGAPIVAAALDLASERSVSPNETRMRLIWELDAGLPRPLINQNVWTLTGKLLGCADLLDEAAGVVGEFDGADHRKASRHSSDVDREDGFRRRRLEFFRVTGPDIPVVPRVVSRMRSARSRAQWLPPDQRPWMIEPPRDWQPEETLDDLLDRRDQITAEQEQWERDGRPAFPS